MITTSGTELAECFENYLAPLNDIDDSVASSSAECNYENFEEFTESVVSDFFEQDLTGIIKERMLFKNNFNDKTKFLQ